MAELRIHKLPPGYSYAYEVIEGTGPHHQVVKHAKTKAEAQAYIRERRKLATRREKLKTRRKGK